MAPKSKTNPRACALIQISKSKMAAHPRSAAKKSPGFYEEVKEDFSEERGGKRPTKKKGEAALRQSQESFEIEARHVCCKSYLQ